MQPSQSVSPQIRQVLRSHILVDTNVWRYLIDLDALETIYRSAKGAHDLILACPAVLYEMLRLEDVSPRRRLIKAICRSR
jgi:predicted nucleic acid-binding protein